MGSIISDADKYTQKKNCKPKIGKGNLCNMVTGPGEILAIRQTIQQDINGRPVLEEFQLESGGQVIDENGTWLIDVPMNMDYYITNEFGEKVLSNDPKKVFRQEVSIDLKLNGISHLVFLRILKEGIF